MSVSSTVEIDQLDLEVSRMAIDEDSEVEDEPSYLVWYVPGIFQSLGLMRQAHCSLLSLARLRTLPQIRRTSALATDERSPGQQEVSVLHKQQGGARASLSPWPRCRHLLGGICMVL